MLVVQREPMSGAYASDPMGTPRIDYFPASSSSRERHSRSVSGLHEDVLNVSPRISYHNPAIHMERRLNYGKSYSFQDAIQARHSTSVASSETPQAKSVADLVREISTLELEVVHLERYLLSLYRAAFDQYLVSCSASVHHKSREHVESNIQNVAKDVDHWKSYRTSNLAVSSEPVDDANCQSKSGKTTDERSFINGCIEQSSEDHLAVGADTKNDMIQYTSGHRSLADHLGASITDHVPEICCKLSEDIVRCIASIYCKLASPLKQSIDPLTSPSPSVSSSSTFSRKELSDSWSPKCHFEVAASPSQTESHKGRSSPYNDMIEVPQLRIDGERFGYASKMLKIFRSLIRRLETIDPRKLTNEEQLAFWINIHNALVMHAFLAYGLRDNRIKSSSSLLKAAYNVGGHSVTAYLIQSSIFGCQPHRPSLWLGKWFSPAVKFMTGNGKHVYALDHFEPLVHFALCSGASSDPALRAYMAKSIYQDLEVAKGEFIQSNVSILDENKVMLPKILEYYAKDAALELADLLKMVCDYMPEAKRRALQIGHKRRLEKFVVWSSYKSSFRYIVHTDLAKEYNPAASYS